MSEYIEIETYIDDESNRVIIKTNLVLTGLGEESYQSAQMMELGSTLAQYISQIDGLQSLIIGERELIATHDPTIPAHIVASEIAAALKEFFL
ncbi:MAG TPA: hypothetical protein VFI27_22245 [candidate division Zixibacteria bacterium]|nr:hypothetical protein [candidate division Zixibacteria bacterium]